MDAERFVFIDETAATTAMTRLSGWAPRGERLVDAVPAGHWKTTTVVAGLRSTGVVAPFVLDGALCARWADDRSRVPRLRRAGARAGAGAGRRGRDGQSLHSQGRRCRGSDPGRGGQRALPAVLLAGSQPHRAAFR